MYHSFFVNELSGEPVPRVHAFWQFKQPWKYVEQKSSRKEI